MYKGIPKYINGTAGFKKQFRIILSETQILSGEEQHDVHTTSKLVWSKMFSYKKISENVIQYDIGIIISSELK